jgi:hypothetical protein
VIEDLLTPEHSDADEISNHPTDTQGDDDDDDDQNDATMVQSPMQVHIISDDPDNMPSRQVLPQTLPDVERTVIVLGSQDAAVISKTPSPSRSASSDFTKDPSKQDMYWKSGWQGYWTSVKHWWHDYWKPPTSWPEIQPVAHIFVASMVLGFATGFFVHYAVTARTAAATVIIVTHV